MLVRASNNLSRNLKKYLENQFLSYFSAIIFEEYHVENAEKVVFSLSVVVSFQQICRDNQLDKNCMFLGISVKLRKQNGVR